MIPEAAKAVADAVLYEGFMLYPYRTTALKNTQRWTFGGLNPRECCRSEDGASGWCQQSEFLIHGSLATRLTATTRFLQLSAPALPSGSSAAPERIVICGESTLEEIIGPPKLREFAFPVDAQAPEEASFATITGLCELSAERIEADLFRVRLRVSNLSRAEAFRTSGCGVYPQTMAAVHAVCCVVDGEFISLTDPPESCREAAAGCRNVGTWPILIGRPGATDVLLCSPIILSDYPQIAPASPGDSFDGTEIDEILTLRIRTLTDDEKQELHAGDERVRSLLQRSDALSPKQLMNLHAQMRRSGDETRDGS